MNCDFTIFDLLIMELDKFYFKIYINEKNMYILEMVNGVFEVILYYKKCRLFE